jgi:DMSO/TMAO reductase YedYZ molybdopterin-dependent catalytic subunit
VAVSAFVTQDEGVTRTDPTPAAPRYRVAGGLLGVLSGAVALGVAQLIAGLLGGESSPMIAVGSASIDAAPSWVKEFAIRTFGANDKRALLIGITVILIIIAIVLGIASIRRPRVGMIGLVVFGAIGLVAALTRPTSGIKDAIPSIVGTAVGIWTFRWLLRQTGLPDPSAPSPSRKDARKRRAEPDVLDRRKFLVGGMYAAIFAGVTGVAGQYFVRRSAASASRSAVRIPAPSSPVPAVPAGAGVDVAGVSPFITPNNRFYKVDTTLLTPAVNADGWQLRIHGMVDKEVTLDYAQLVALPLVERDVTLTCVSNEVGGSYVGNARWVGALLKPILEQAGIDPAADQLVSRSADGFTAGSPTATVMDGRDSMLAVSMNGEPLPLAHGFPVRMIVPGLYGYVSATKWLVDLELTTFAAYDAYWIKRGWSQQGPIKTESRIDTPGSGAQVSAGQVAVAGVAWAQHRGISRVEVSVDQGAWQPAELGTQDTIDTWRQWVYRWNATSGQHTLQVRATDNTGETQTADLAPPAPNGATGYHTIEVNVA